MVLKIYLLFGHVWSNDVVGMTLRYVWCKFGWWFCVQLRKVTGKSRLWIFGGFRKTKKEEMLQHIDAGISSWREVQQYMMVLGVCMCVRKCVCKLLIARRSNMKHHKSCAEGSHWGNRRAVLIGPCTSLGDDGSIRSCYMGALESNLCCIFIIFILLVSCVKLHTSCPIWASEFFNFLTVFCFSFSDQKRKSPKRKNKQRKIPPKREEKKNTIR